MVCVVAGGAVRGVVGVVRCGVQDVSVVASVMWRECGRRCHERIVTGVVARCKSGGR